MRLSLLVKDRQRLNEERLSEKKRDGMMGVDQEGRGGCWLVP